MSGALTADETTGEDSMEEIAGNLAFKSYAICSSILAVKMILSAFWTGANRQIHQGYVSAEDARVFGRKGVQAGEREAPEVARALRIQRNDLENIPAFFAIGLIYVLSGASAFGAAVYCWTFTIARLVHTIVYMRRLQPWRAICYAIGVMCMFGMVTQIILNAI
jgi:uncharacterized MAPEG superfamily protein